MLFPVSCVNSLNKFPEARKGVWLVVVDHFIFDMFGKSIVGLSVECCIRVFSQRSNSYLMVGVISIVWALVAWLWGLVGFFDMGFSLCTVPIYYPMSKYFG